MRIIFSYNCSEEYCKKIDKLLKPHGLKTLFLQNILKKMIDDNGIIPESRIKAVIMNDFNISFNDNSNSNSQPEPEINPKLEQSKNSKENKLNDKFEKMREISNNFAKGL